MFNRRPFSNCVEFWGMQRYWRLPPGVLRAVKPNVMIALILPLWYPLFPVPWPTAVYQSVIGNRNQPLDWVFGTYGVVAFRTSFLPWYSHSKNSSTFFTAAWMYLLGIIAHTSTLSGRRTLLSFAPRYNMGRTNRSCFHWKEFVDSIQSLLRAVWDTNNVIHVY